MGQEVSNPSAVSRAAMMAMAGALALTPLAGAKTINGLGDSRTRFSSLYSPTAGAASAGTLTRKGGQSFLHHAEMQSKGKLIFDMALGYAGPINGILKVIVTNGGANYTAPTITFNQGATGTVQTVGGVITGVTITNPGNGTSAFTYTLNDASGSGAALSIVDGGHGTFGTNGSTTAGMVARLPDVLANLPDILTVLGGYNDINSGLSFAAITGNLKICCEAAMSAGAAVILIVEPGEGNLTAAQRQLLERLRKWARAYVHGRAFANPLGFRRIALADVTPLTIDMTTTAGTIASGMTVDLVHQTQLMAKIVGEAVWTAAQQFTGPAPTASSRVVSHADGFDRVLNPGGYVTILNASPVFVSQSADQSAAATVGSVTVSGTKPQDWLIGRNAGSAAGTLVAAIETPYTDGRPGRRPTLTFSLGSGTATEQWQLGTGNLAYAQCGAIGGAGNQLLSAADLSGQLFELICEVELAGTVANLTQLTPFVFDVTNTVYPARAGVEQSGSQQKVFNSAEQRPITSLFIRTAAFPLPSNLDKLGYGLQIGFDCSGGAGSATGTIKVNCLALRPYGVA